MRKENRVPLFLIPLSCLAFSGTANATLVKEHKTTRIKLHAAWP